MLNCDVENIDSLWDFSDPAESELRFRALLAKATLPEHASEHVIILTQIARAQGLQRRFDEAHEVLNHAESMLSKEISVPRIRLSLERGRIYNSSGKAEESQSCFLKALEEAEKDREEYFAVDAAHMLGIVTEPSEQLEWNLRAMEVAESTTDARAKKWLGPLYNNIGWTYHDVEEFDRALEMLEKALGWYERNGTDRQIRIGKWSVARVFRSVGRTEEALQMQQGLIVEWGAAGESDGYVFEELAECMLLLGNNEEARLNFGLAYAELSKDEWLVANEVNRLERLKSLSIASK